MKEFFKGKAFKIIIAIAVLLIGVIVGGAVSGRSVSFFSDILGTVATPFQSAAAWVRNGVADIGKWLTQRTAVFSENELLKEQVEQLREQVAEYEELKQENRRLNDMLGITEKREDFQMVAATVISRGDSEYYDSFTVNKGTLHGVKLRDAVVTTAGVVGYVSDVSLNYCKVTTLFSPSCNIGGYDVSSVDFGVLTGNSQLAAQGLFLFTYLPNDALVTVGDIVVTSGLGSIYPTGLVAGTVVRVTYDSQGVSMDAVLAPSAEISELREVLIITGFDPESGVEYTMPEASENGSGETAPEVSQ